MKFHPKQVFEQIKENKKDHEALPTGFPNLDKKLDGGFFKKELIILGAHTGIGKCFSKGTKIMMFSGKSKKAENILPGDELMGNDSTKRTVLSITTGRDKLYKISPIKGKSFVVNSLHKLSLKNTKTKKILNISVDDYLKLSSYKKHLLKLYRVGVDFQNKTRLKIPPYFLGVWLGDGTSKSVDVTTQDEEIKEYLYSIAQKFDLSIKIHKSKNKQCPTYRITNKNGVHVSYCEPPRLIGNNKTECLVCKTKIDTFASRIKNNKGKYCSKKCASNKPSKNKLLNLFKQYNLILNKHIPWEYKTSNRKNRLELLAGIIDTDGYVSTGGYTVSIINKKLANDICFVSRSLGFASYLKKYKAKISSINYEVTAYKVSISGDCNQIPVKLNRKKVSKRLQKKDVLVTGFTVHPQTNGQYYGFEVDKNKLFLLGDFTVTHNSQVAGQIFQHIATKGYKSAYFSLEISNEMVVSRLAGAIANIKPTVLRYGWLTEEQQKKKAEAEAELISLGDLVSLYDDLYELKDIVKEIQENEYEFIVIDFIQNVMDLTVSDEYTRLSKISLTLQKLAKDQNVCILVLSQLSNQSAREGAKSKVLEYKGSGTIATVCDLGLFLDRDINGDEASNQVFLRLRKNRRGVAGIESVLNYNHPGGYLNEQ